MTDVKFICPIKVDTLERFSEYYCSFQGPKYSIINGIPRFCSIESYSESFRFQWNIFDKNCTIIFSGHIKYPEGTSTVVRSIKKV